MKMTLLLFVYGTLLPEIAAPEVLPIVKSLDLAGIGYVRGTLYDLGNYPGAVLNEDAKSWIIGRVYRLPELSLIRFFDSFEDFNPSDKSVNLFIRQLTKVQMDSGDVKQCWIYTYNHRMSFCPVIESGDYLGYLRGQGKLN